MQLLPTRVTPPPFGGAGVHGHVFADDVVLTDDEFGVFAGVGQALRRLAERGERIDDRPLPIVVRPSTQT